MRVERIREVSEERQGRPVKVNKFVISAKSVKLAAVIKVWKRVEGVSNISKVWEGEQLVENKTKSAS